MNIDFTGKTLSTSDPAGNIRRKHEGMRRDLESALGETWRIITLYERSRSRYSPTLATHTSDHPAYTIASIEADHEFEAIEDGPRDKVIDDELVAIPRPRLYGTVKLMADGRLRIMETSLVIPSKQR